MRIISKEYLLKNIQISGGTGEIFRFPLVGVADEDTVTNFVSPDASKKQNESDIHVYPFKSNHEQIQSPRGLTGANDLELPDEILDTFDTKTKIVNPLHTTLQPDPILRLKKLIGFGAQNPKTHESFNNLIWSRDSQYLIYSCQAVVIAYHVNTSEQWCFVGHADKVSCLAINVENTMIASGQTGQFSLVRIWDFQTRKCVAIFRNHDHSLHLLEFSTCGKFLCGIGKDKQGKTMVIIWDLKDIKCSVNIEGQNLASNTVRIVAKAHTDVHVTKVLFVHYDSSRLITCGRENVRFWRLKDDTLRSCAVNLSPYIQALNMNSPYKECYEEGSRQVQQKVFLEFTDLCMNSNGVSGNDHFVYACTKTGQIFEFNIAKMEIENVRVLEPLIKKKTGTFLFEIN